MVIQHNMQAMNADRQFGVVSSQKNSSMEKLSSGYKINRSADDAAGLSISEKMRKQIRGLDRASLNIEDGISYAQVADGALNEVEDMLQRINELSIQAANGTNSESDRSFINAEVQQLKSEMERVFKTTRFNERFVWEGDDPTIIKTVIGKSSVIGVTFSNAVNNTVMTNESYQYMPVQSPSRSTSSSLYYTTSNSYSYFKTTTDENKGIAVTWDAYNGNTYTSEYISWEKLQQQSNKFNLSTLLNKVTEKKPDGTISEVNLHDSNGDPMFNYELSFGISSAASNAQRATALNDKTLYNSNGISLKPTSNTDTSDVRICAYSMTTASAFADRATNDKAGNTSTGFDYKNTNSSDIIPALNGSGGNFSKDGGIYTFTFDCDGLGTVKAKASYIGYRAPSGTTQYSSHIAPSYAGYSNTYYTDEFEDVWWKKTESSSGYYVNGKKYKYDYNSLIHNKNISTTNTDDAIRDALTGSLADAKSSDSVLPGILNSTPGATEGGAAGTAAGNGAGTIYLSFDLDSENEYTYGNNQKSKIVGEIVYAISVKATDTATDVEARIAAAINGTTKMNIATNTSASSKLTNNYVPAATIVHVDVPQLKTSSYMEDIDLDIHSGSETTDKINFHYDCLRLATIGMEGTNTLTQEDALKAIDQVSEALAHISAQRSLFGAYQNRMEHAYNINQNTSENTQAAESKIRDTDMASEMVKYSNTNILQQAGQSMLSQANQANQEVLSLIQ